MPEPIKIDLWECPNYLCGKIVAPRRLPLNMKECPSCSVLINTEKIKESYQCPVCNAFLVLDFEKARAHVNMPPDDSKIPTGFIFFSSILGKSNYNVIVKNNLKRTRDHSFMHEIETYCLHQEGSMLKLIPRFYKSHIYLSYKRLDDAFKRGYFVTLNKVEFSLAKKLFHEPQNKARLEGVIPGDLAMHNPDSIFLQ